TLVRRAIHGVRGRQVDLPFAAVVLPVAEQERAVDVAILRDRGVETGLDRIGDVRHHVRGYSEALVGPDHRPGRRGIVVLPVEPDGVPDGPAPGEGRTVVQRGGLPAGNGVRRDDAVLFVEVPLS